MVANRRYVSAGATWPARWVKVVALIGNKVKSKAIHSLSCRIHWSWLFVVATGPQLVRVIRYGPKGVCTHIALVYLGHQRARLNSYPVWHKNSSRKLSYVCDDPIPTNVQYLHISLKTTRFSWLTSVKNSTVTV